MSTVPLAPPDEAYQRIEARITKNEKLSLPFGGKPVDLDQCTEFGAWLVGAILSGQVDARVGREAAAALNVLRGVLASKDLAAYKVDKIKRQLQKAMQDRARDPRDANR